MAKSTAAAAAAAVPATPLTVVDNNYPGAKATATDMMCLALEYHRAAIVLLGQGRKGAPLSRAPGRLVCIHAVELYLNALLVQCGLPAPVIRGLQHDLATRAGLAAENGLVLRRRTLAHISALSSNREYVVSRYGPEMTTTLSQVNRLLATLEEVASKVTAAVNGKAAAG